MYEPAADDEITSLRNYLDQQLTAIRAAAHIEEIAAASPRTRWMVDPALASAPP